MSTPTADAKGPPLVPDDGNTLKKSSKKSTSSKRPSDFAPASGATPTSSPAMPDVPRLVLAEPKADLSGGGDAAPKPRPAKKRTSTPENAAGPSLLSGAVVAEPSAPAAVAKSDADAEKEKAKREAKKQRARELEEQRKRDELERQAVEEARQRDEQKQREKRRQQDLAALNANADVVQDDDGDGYDDDGFEDYGDGDFEKDDVTVAPAKAPLLPQQTKSLAKAKGMPPRDATEAAPSLDLKRIQDAQKAESKELLAASPVSSARATAKSSSKGVAGTSVSDTQKSSSSGSASTASSIAASIAGLKQTLDPRAKRAKEIRDFRKLDVEKFNTFVQAPIAEVEIYLSRLRRRNVRQVAVQTKDDDKSVFTQTKVPDMEDKSMHFPDDVGIDGASSGTTMKARGKRQKKNSSTGNQEEEDEEEEEEEVDEEEGEEGSDKATVSSMKFLTFLEQSSQVCEQLIQDNLQESERLRVSSSTSNTDSAGRGGGGRTAAQLSSKTLLSNGQLFPPTPKSLDGQAAAGLGKLLDGRHVTQLEFACAVSNLLVTWYGAASRSVTTTGRMTTDDQDEGKDEGKDEEPQEKGLVPCESFEDKPIACVWDLNQLDHVLYFLKSDGIVTTSCFGPTRDLLVLAGTEDGSINVWDLRSRLALCNGKYAPQYGCELYSPTYSTCGADSRSIEGSHQSAIVCVRVVERKTNDTSSSIGSGSSSGATMVQFGSLDDRGTLLMWSMVDYGTDARHGHGSDATALLKDKCLAIGGRIKCVVTVVIETQSQYVLLTRPSVRAHVRKEPSSSLSFHSTNTKTKSSEQMELNELLGVGPIMTVFTFLPNDPNEFIVGTATGLVLRANKYETKQKATAAEASSITTSTGTSCYRRDRQGSGLHVGGVAVTCLAFHPMDDKYFLVGYEDGRICLFDVAIAVAICCWQEVEAFGDSDNNNGSVSVVSLQWSPSRAGVFFASYSHGLVHVWDLTVQRHAPVVEHTLEKQKGVLLGSYAIALSSEKMRTSRPSIAMCCGGEEPFHFQVHELSAEFTTSTKNEAKDVTELLASIF